MAANYKKIKGVNYVRDLIELADSSLTGKGEGSITISGARKIIKKVKDTNTFSEVEIKTLKYIRDNYHFNPEAKKYFKDEVNKIKPAQKGSVKKTAKLASETKKTSVTVVKKKSAGTQKSKPKPQAKPKPKSKAPVKPRPAPKPDPAITNKIKPPVQEIVFPEELSPLPVLAEKKEKSSPLKIVVSCMVIIIIGAIIYVMLPDINKTILPKKKAGVEIAPEAAETRVDSEKLLPDTETKPPKIVDLRHYRIQYKDQLTEISLKFYGNYADWKKIYEANKDKIQNPNIIFPGHTIKIPDPD